MPKATLTFSLPEETSEYKTTIDAGKYVSILCELDNYLRSRTKYAPENQPDQVTDTLYEIREKLWELIREENVDIY